MKTSEHSDGEQGNHHMLSRREMGERLRTVEFDLSCQGMELTGAQLRREHQALETARQLAEWLENCVPAEGICADLEWRCPAYYSDDGDDGCRARDWLEGGGAET